MIITWKSEVLSDEVFEKWCESVKDCGHTIQPNSPTARQRKLGWDAAIAAMKQHDPKCGTQYGDLTYWCSDECANKLRPSEIRLPSDMRQQIESKIMESLRLCDTDRDPWIDGTGDAASMILEYLQPYLRYPVRKQGEISLWHPADRREEFEKAAKREGLGVIRNSRDPNMYESPYTQFAWQGFKMACDLRTPVREVSSGWQPIETAPKDGLNFLIHNEDGVMVAHYHITDQRFVGIDKTTTHWMFLPKPPTKQIEGGQS